LLNEELVGAVSGEDEELEEQEEASGRSVLKTAIKDQEDWAA
jgi:hypothetical protein